MKGKKLIIIISVVVLGILLLCCCTVGGAILLGNSSFNISQLQDVDDPVDDDDYTEEEDLDEDDLLYPPSEDDDTSDTQDQTSAPTTGTITGFVSYPSEFIPDGMTICAEPDADTDSYCTTELIEHAASLPTYELELPPGGYYVYAYDADGDPDYKAFYSEFVTCGLSIECTSHDPILVTVVAGETLEDIDPGDWYAP